MNTSIKTIRPVLADAGTQSELQPKIDKLWQLVTRSVAKLKGEQDIEVTFMIVGSNGNAHAFSAHLHEEAKSPFMAQMRHLVETYPGKVDFAALMYPAYIYPVAVDGAAVERDRSKATEGVILYIETESGHMVQVKANLSRSEGDAPVLGPAETEWLSPEVELAGRMVGFFPDRGTINTVQ